MEYHFLELNSSNCPSLMRILFFYWVGAVGVISANLQPVSSNDKLINPV